MQFGVQDSSVAKLNDLDFADDIALFDDSISSAVSHVERLEAEASSVGLRINYGKTKAKMININNVQDTLEVGVNEIEVVNDFKYLGSTILSSMTDFLKRRGMAWSNFWRLHKVWKSNKLPLQLKLRLLDALIMSVLLYGSETWIVTKTVSDKEHVRYRVPAVTAFCWA